MSLLASPSLAIKLAEPSVFVYAPNRAHPDQRPTAPALVRGLLVLKLPKATKITSIDVLFEGQSTTEWPEGIGPRRLEISEHIPLVSLRTSFLDGTTTDRRAHSLGPGIRFDDYEVVDHDDFLHDYPRSNGPAPTGNPAVPDGNAQQQQQQDLHMSADDRRSVPGVPSRAASAFPIATRDQRSFPTTAQVQSTVSTNPQPYPTPLASPLDETPPYTPRAVPDSLPQSPLVLSPRGENETFNLPTPADSIVSTNETLSETPVDRGRPVRPSLTTTPDGPPSRRHSYHAELGRDASEPSSVPETPTTTTSDGEPRLLEDGDAIDPENHPMSVILEDSDLDTAGADLSRPPVDTSFVDVRSTPNTGPPSAASSVNGLQLRRYHSSSSSIEQSGAEQPASPTQAAAPAASTSSSLHIPSSAGGTPGLSPTSSRTNPTSLNSRPPSTTEHNSSIARRISSRASSLLTHTPSTTTAPTTPTISSDPPRPHHRSSSPTVSRPTVAAASTSSSSTTRAFSGSGSTLNERSPSRGRSTSNRFSFSAVTHMLREVSQDVRDAVGSGSGTNARDRGRDRDRNGEHGHAHGHRSGSRTAQGTALSLSRAPSLVGDERVPAGAEGSPTPGGSFVRGYGRGGAGSRDRDGGGGSRSRTRTGERPRAARDGAVDDDGELAGRRGRDVTINPIGEAAEIASSSKGNTKDGWREFRKGTYTYPISFAIPPDLPPSLRCDFGSVSYRLKATVHRAGTFAPKVTTSVDVNVVSCLSPDSTEDLDNIIVQRSWEDKLSYVVHIDGTAFPVGTTIPVGITIMPLEKISLYRLSIGIDEKIDYYAQGRKVARHEPVQHYELINLRQEDKHQRLLPIISDSTAAATSSPLAPYTRPEADAAPDMVIPPSASTETLEQTSDVASHLLNPSGPWHFRFDVTVPDCHSGIHFTNKGNGARVVILHRLKTVLRVSAGAPPEKDKPKLFDIIIETPIHLMSCQCQPNYTHLPTYTLYPTALTPPAHEHTPSPSPSRFNDMDRRHHHHNHHSHSSSSRRMPILAPPIGPQRTMGSPLYARTTSPQVAGHSHSNMLSFVSTTGNQVTVRSPAHPPQSSDEHGRIELLNTAAALRNTAEAHNVSEQFARLVAGQESEQGEQPPAYSS